MKETSIIKEGRILGNLYSEGNSYFLMGFKGTKITELYIEVFKVLKTSFTLGSSIGALEDIKIGYRNNETKKYEITTIAPSHEILNLSGNVGLKPHAIVFPHLHVSLSDEECNVKGGHLVDATISITLESRLELLPSILQRSFDSITGLDLITSSHKG